jgi:flagellar hook-basal body complex protein FliE
MREEEIERLLADLEKRCRYMLALQIEVRDGTVTLDAEIQKNADPKKPEVAQAARSNAMADKEDLIVREADAALKILEGEGSAVAFAEVFKQVRTDMVNVKNRLAKTDTGKVTVTIENDIIETLTEMIAALQKAQKEAKAGQPKPGQPKQGMPQDQKLIDMIAELKMIYAMQRRVNNRTELYGKQYKGEQAPLPTEGANAKEKEHYQMIKRELQDLSERQDKIQKVTRDIATGKNESR